MNVPVGPHPVSVDVACAGESMAMFVTEHSGELSNGAVYRLSVAGAESNVAMYLSKLGVRTTWISRVGADLFGSFILNELENSGVDVPTPPSTRPNRPESRSKTVRARTLASVIFAPDLQRVR